MMLKANTENILVVGGAGYIGSVFVRKLLAKGYGVTVLDNLIYGNGETMIPLTENEAFRFIKGDLCDGKLVSVALNKADKVVVLAALVGDPICRKYQEETKRVNDRGTIELIDRVRDAGIGRLVYMSTCSNYGLRENDEAADEKSELNPKSLYAELKVKVERRLLEEPRKGTFKPVILRAATAMGQSYRMRFDLTVSEFTRELFMGRELVVYDEETWRPYCHVQDISDAIITVLDASNTKVEGEVFNVGSDSENYTKRMIVDRLLEKIPGARVKYQKGGSDPRNYRVSFRKIRESLGYQIHFNLDRTIDGLIAALKGGMYDNVEARRNYHGNYHLTV